jgi:hypothetical protein
MSGDREELIRKRAYALWEQEGGDHGRHDDHWLQAVDEIDGVKKSPKPRATRALKAKPAATPESAPAKAKTALKPETKAIKTAPAKPAKPVPAAKAKGG